MDKNTLTGMVLIALLFISYSILFPPPPPTPPSNNPDSLQVTNNGTPTNGQGNAVNPFEQQKPERTKQEGLFQQNPSEQEDFTTLENDLLKVTFSNKGGRIYKTELKQYKTYSQEPLVLMDGPDNEFGYVLPVGNYIAHTQDYFFTKESNGNQAITYRLYVDDQTYIEQVYRLQAGSYVVDYDFNLVGFEGRLRTGTVLELNWQNQLLQQEKHFDTEKYTTGVYYKIKNDNVSYLSENAEDEEEINLSLTWVSHKQSFFNNTLIADEGFKRGKLAINDPPLTAGEKVLEVASSNLTLDYKRMPNFSFPMHFYIGPNDYHILSDLKVGEDDDLAMHEMIPLGWFIFRWVNVWVILPMFNFLNGFIGNYGIIILILTLVIKTVLSPLTFRSYNSFAKMNVLKPEIEALKEKYKDPQKQQMETMKLYGKAGVNPLGGCLPQLIQFPILIAMYRFFPASIELRQESFLWADDLSSYDSILDLPFNIPLYGDHISLFCLLSAISSLIYIRLNSQMTPTGGNSELANQMKIIQYIMPVSLLFFFNNFAAGLTYYFFLSNVTGFVQQYAIKNFFIDEDKLRRQIQEHKKKPVKKSKWQQRLEELQKVQKAQQAAQKKKQTNRGRKRK